jgi:hypothetical protein
LLSSTSLRSDLRIVYSRLKEGKKKDLRKGKKEREKEKERKEERENIIV